MSRPQTDRVPSSGLPPLDRVVVRCPMCGTPVRVSVVREFVAVFRRVCALAGVRLAADLPVLTARCIRGHIVVVPLESVELAS